MKKITGIIIILVTSCNIYAQSADMHQLGVLGGQIGDIQTPHLTHAMGAITGKVLNNNESRLDQGMFLACDMPCENLVCGTIGIHREQQHDWNVNVYPNPTQNTLHLEGEAKDIFDYMLFSTDGKCIRKGEIQQAEISFSGLPTGLYLLKVYDQRGKLSLIERVVRQ